MNIKLLQKHRMQASTQLQKLSKARISVRCMYIFFTLLTFFFFHFVQFFYTEYEPRHKLYNNNNKRKTKAKPKINFSLYECMFS